jgi:hypothetical protein
VHILLWSCRGTEGSPLRLVPSDAVCLSSAPEVPLSIGGCLPWRYHEMQPLFLAPPWGVFCGVSSGLQQDGAAPVGRSRLRDAGLRARSTLSKQQQQNTRADSGRGTDLSRDRSSGIERAQSQNAGSGTSLTTLSSVTAPSAMGFAWFAGRGRPLGLTFRPSRLKNAVGSG